MKKSIVVGLCVLLFAALTANAAEKEKTHLRATLRSFAEVPSNVTDGTGTFRAVVNDDTTITFTLTYHNLTAPAAVSHIHIGARNVAGGVTLFLCGPAGSPAHQVCPNDATNSGTVTDTLTAADVLAIAGSVPQGIAAGDLAKVLRAIANGVTYVNVHNANFGRGEIRGQIIQREDDEDDE